jgi:hypothetical protein
LDVPADIKDWWIYLIPGDSLLVELLFLYDILTHISGSSLTFSIFDFCKYNQAQLGLLLLIAIVLGLIIGSALEGISFSLFGDGDAPKLSAFDSVVKTEKDLMVSVFSDSRLFPKELWKGSLDEMRHHIQTLAEFAENYLAREATSEQVSESLEETARAITFTQNFFVAFAFFPFVVLWFAINGAPAIAILLLIGYLGGLAYLFRDSSKLTSIYWQKTLRFFVTELWSRSSKLAA